MHELHWEAMINDKRKTLLCDVAFYDGILRQMSHKIQTLFNSDASEPGASWDMCKSTHKYLYDEFLL